MLKPMLNIKYSALNVLHHGYIFCIKLRFMCYEMIVNLTWKDCVDYIH